MKLKDVSKSKTKRYCEKYDAFFDIKTGRWLERACGGKKCDFCAKRPTKHSPHRWQFPDLSYGVCK
jgi:nitrite reductase/ring-hydroxylating ferredoxin subunit